MYDIYEVLKTQVRDGASEFAVGPFLYSLVLIIRAQRILDLGTGHGFSMLSMALAMKELYENSFPVRQQHKQRIDIDYEEFERLREPPILVTIDLNPNPVVNELIEKYELEGYVKLVYDNIFGFSQNLQYSQWDLIFLDATKSKEEFIEYIPLVRKGGLFVLHDYFGSHVADMCSKLDQLDELEGLVCDTGYMSFKVYRVISKLSKDSIRKCLE